MEDRLDQIAIQRNEPKAEIVRAALRAYLDEQEDLLGSRKHFSKMFQRRMDYQDWMMIVLMELITSSFGEMVEILSAGSLEKGAMLDTAITTARRRMDRMHTKLLSGLVEK
jgi:hypothetical protein